MRKTIAIVTAVALATCSLPAFASPSAPHKRLPPSLTDLVTEYAGTIADAPPLVITAALTLIAGNGTFNATAATTTIEASVGTASFIPTTVAQINAAIAARLAANGPDYVVGSKAFYAAAMAAKTKPGAK